MVADLDLPQLTGGVLPNTLGFTDRGAGHLIPRQASGPVSGGFVVENVSLLLSCSVTQPVSAIGASLWVSSEAIAAC